jgi:hypothetical protein
VYFKSYGLYKGASDDYRMGTCNVDDFNAILLKVKGTNED